MKFLAQVQFSDVDVLGPGPGGHWWRGVAEELQQRKLTFCLTPSSTQLCEWASYIYDKLNPTMWAPYGCKMIR